MNKKIRQLLKPVLQNVLVREIWGFWKALSASWRIYLETPVPIEELLESRQAASIPSFGFFFILICSALLATLGLLANSTAVIIGAMIVAPLMNPILSMAFAIVIADWTLYKRSLVTVFLGASCTIFISYLLSALFPINIVGNEILARISPNLLDLGIAIVAGAAGSFSLTRKSIASSIAGVAIAVALVPPLCVTGIGLGIGNSIAGDISQVIVTHLSVSGGAMLLFLVNLAGITFTACLVFLSQDYGSLKKAFQTILIWLLIMAFLCGPLTGSMKKFLLVNSVNFQISELREQHPEIAKKSQVRYINVTLEGSTAYITVLINAPKGLMTDEYLKSAENKLFDSISKKGIKSMKLTLRIVPVEIKEYTVVR